MFEKLLETFFQGAVKKGTLGVTFADGRTARYGTAAPDFPDVSIRFTSARAARRIVTDPALGAAEAFMDGSLVVAGDDILGLVRLFRANAPWERGASMRPPRPLRRLKDKALHKLASYNAARSSKKNVAHHYDLGNDFYRLFLDRQMQYSCAYWPREGMTLDEAQEAKLAHIAAKLHLEPGMTVLDIGCGWGGLAIWLAKRCGARVTGITLSEEQLALARQNAQDAGVADRVTFELIDYRDMAARGDRFDRIVSVGMFEHVGQPQFETFFRACSNLLTDQGVMMLHTIGLMGKPGVTDAFTRKYIFPGGYIPALSETVAASEPVRLMIADVEILRLHYAYTLLAWYDRCVAHRAEIEAMFGAKFYRMWLFYLAGAATGFESSALCNFQIIYTRDRHALPITRGWIEAAEERLASSAPVTDTEREAAE
ncbi:class I SAM-dependent methyltransferase [Parablastomonas sp. CN1-191]|uniref:class I SAM-dependent methyltransferase n=1 Tax=Parablastomonas sp. CN1-191 TaxID=3400908 RepID=UPI003BF8F980